MWRESATVGARMAVLEASMRLLSGPEQTYRGRYYDCDELTIERLAKVPPVWVAGGRQYAHAASPKRPVPRMDDNLLRRICAWHGWIARPTSPPELIAVDLRDIDQELASQGSSRAAKGLVVAHENFAWLGERAGHDDAVAEQRERMLQVVSSERPWDYIEAVYLTGTIDEVQRKIQDRVEVGVEHLVLHTMSADLSQLDLLARHILGPFGKTSAQSQSTTTAI